MAPHLFARPYFIDVNLKKVVHDLCMFVGRKYSHKKLTKNISGKFGEIRAKTYRTPKDLPVPMQSMMHV